MLKRVMIGALFAVLAAALPTACSSSKSNGSGGSGGAGGSGGNATGGTAGSGGNTEGGSSGGSGGTAPYQDADLDAPYNLPDGGCGQIFCPAAVAASCPKFAQSLNDCANFCSKIAQSSCSTQWDAVMTCAGASPNVQCDSNGQISLPGCDTQVQAFVTCFTALQQDGGL